MRKAEAEALRVKWKQRGLSRSSELSACMHPNQELEWHEDGYVTHNYRCMRCGELVAKKP